jgi:hypothetical protein
MCDVSEQSGRFRVLSLTLGFAVSTVSRQGSGVQLTDADYINESGEITAGGVLPNGDNHAFPADPVRRASSRYRGLRLHPGGRWRGAQGTAADCDTWCIRQRPVAHAALTTQKLVSDTG